MESKNIKKEEPTTGNKMKAEKDLNVDNENTPLKNEPDTAPDDFISPNADTDQPLDGHVMNDAVLFGEDHASMPDLDQKSNKEPRKPSEKDKGNL